MKYIEVTFLNNSSFPGSPLIAAHWCICLDGDTTCDLDHKYFSKITENAFQKVLANAKFVSCLFFILFHFSFSVKYCALLEVRVHASSFVYSLHKGDLVQYMFVQLNQVASLDKALSCLMFKSGE